MQTLEEIKGIAEHQQVLIVEYCTYYCIYFKSGGSCCESQQETADTVTTAALIEAWEKQLGTLKEGIIKYISVGERSNVEVKDDIGNVVGEELVLMNLQM